MKRRAFNLLVGASLVLSLAIAALWIRSYFAGYELWKCWIHEKLAASVGRGEFGFSTEWRPKPDASEVHRAGLSKSPPQSLLDYVVHPHFGFGYERVEFSIEFRMDNGPPSKPELLSDTRTVVLPIRLPFALTAAVALLGIWRIIRNRHRTDTNLCQACGYDLRATPNRCPECGTSPMHG